MLIPECSDSDGNPFTDGMLDVDQQNTVQCLIDVLGTDWTQ